MTNTADMNNTLDIQKKAILAAKLMVNLDAGMRAEIARAKTSSNPAFKQVCAIVGCHPTDGWMVVLSTIARMMPRTGTTAERILHRDNYEIGTLLAMHNVNEDRILRFVNMPYAQRPLALARMLDVLPRGTRMDVGQLAELAISPSRDAARSMMLKYYERSLLTA